jgi:hypothetical protein
MNNKQNNDKLMLICFVSRHSLHIMVIDWRFFSIVFHIFLTAFRRAIVEDVDRVADGEVPRSTFFATLKSRGNRLSLGGCQPKFGRKNLEELKFVGFSDISRTFEHFHNKFSSFLNLIFPNIPSTASRNRLKPIQSIDKS